MLSSGGGGTKGAKARLISASWRSRCPARLPTVPQGAGCLSARRGYCTLLYAYNSYPRERRGCGSPWLRDTFPTRHSEHSQSRSYLQNPQRVPPSNTKPLGTAPYRRSADSFQLPTATGGTPRVTTSRSLHRWREAGPLSSLVPGSTVTLNRWTGGEERGGRSTEFKIEESSVRISSQRTVTDKTPKPPTFSQAVADVGVPGQQGVPAAEAQHQGVSQTEDGEGVGDPVVAGPRLHATDPLEGAQGITPRRVFLRALIGCNPSLVALVPPGGSARMLTATRGALRGARPTPQ
ncbi:hypothetical protein EYF80_047733 [Liparis tanakae]|uniref:Uncharacterized protein n=1 Tax=Liparis tanakae TaxID=230148 RepID=A0A4Z2FLS3_9TELE|nr:hypothetical protein EYF80_047733 [Liparis tanakae]